MIEYYRCDDVVFYKNFLKNRCVVMSECSYSLSYSIIKQHIAGDPFYCDKIRCCGFSVKVIGDIKYLEWKFVLSKCFKIGIEECDDVYKLMNIDKMVSVMFCWVEKLVNNLIETYT